MVIIGIVKDSVDTSYTNKDGVKVVQTDNLVSIPCVGQSLHLRGKKIHEDLSEVSLIAHATKERNMIWFSFENE